MSQPVVILSQIPRARARFFNRLAALLAVLAPLAASCTELMPVAADGYDASGDALEFVDLATLAAEADAHDLSDAPALGGAGACAPGALGEPGCPCLENLDCHSGFCVTGAGGLECTATCDLNCPDGYACSEVANPAGDPVFICLDRHIFWCMPCATAQDCAHPSVSSSPNRCEAATDGGGSFCITACRDDADCPTSSACVEDGAGESWCRPTEGECPCSPLAQDRGAETACARTNDHGSCTGARSCSAEGLSACDAPEPAPESCDGVDDDCDGLIDEDAAVSEMACDGPDADVCANGVWSCEGGVEVCQEPGAGAVEVCNGSDDDCDGLTDEAFPAGAPCDGDDADHCEDGVFVCGAAGAVCDEPTGAGHVEVCNGVDDDCDGLTDEDTSTAEPCDGPDLDECPTGTRSCAGGVESCDEAPGVGSMEACNGLDDDCDGATDEGFPGLGEPCDGPDADECALGTRICGPAGKVVCAEAPELAQVELCNGLDDDCDGTADDAFPQLGLACDGPDSDSCKEGLYACTPEGAMACSEPTSGGHVELCNGLDDDCDGVIDDGFDVGATCDGAPWAEGCGSGSLICNPSGTGVVCDPWAEGLNIVSNGGFDGVEDLQYWPDFDVYINPSLPPSAATCTYDPAQGCGTAPSARCTFMQPVGTPWYYIFQYTGFPVVKGEPYILKLCGRGSTPGQKLRVGVQEHSGPTDVFPAVAFPLSVGAWECRAFTFIAAASFTDSKVVIQLGDASAGPVWIDDVRLECLDPSCAAAGLATD